MEFREKTSGVPTPTVSEQVPTQTRQNHVFERASYPPASLPSSLFPSSGRRKRRAWVYWQTLPARDSSPDTKLIPGAGQVFRPGTRRKQAESPRGGTSPDPKKPRSIHQGFPAVKMEFPFAAGLIPSEPHPQSLSISRCKAVARIVSRCRA